MGWGGGVTHPFNPDPRVVVTSSGGVVTPSTRGGAGVGLCWCTTQSRPMTHRISVTQICNCVAALSVLASRHFFPAITERNSSLCDGLNVWPFLAF